MMTLPDQFDIHDVEFHTNALAELNPNDTYQGVHILIAWHVTAVALLQIGERIGFDGPATETWVNEPHVHLEITPVERVLTMDHDAHGAPFFRHTPVVPEELGFIHDSGELNDYRS